MQPLQRKRSRILGAQLLKIVYPLSTRGCVLCPEHQCPSHSCRATGGQLKTSDIGKTSGLHPGEEEWLPSSGLLWDARAGSLLCHLGWSTVAQSQLTAASTSCAKVILLPRPSQDLGQQACTTTCSYIF
ncbi:putative phosphatidylinositol 3,4,5-trisphosphate 3-phosphatase TPTE2P1 [Plecturocebus cupreus]